ncbi:MAG: 4Fe-4S binding protein [Flavobacteriales bacterium]|jgi:polyferredoxin|nr:4Fe-4S binding protein [Flavobacteriales bacterium]
MKQHKFISIANPTQLKLDTMQKMGLGLALAGTAIIFIAWGGLTFSNPSAWLIFSLASIVIGTTIYARQTYLKHPEGIKNNGVWFDSLTNGGVIGWAFGILLTLFYVFLYWWPEYVGMGKDGNPNTGLVALFDPLSHLFSGKPASQWFVYGTLYTTLILGLGIKFIYKYRHNRYQVWRTISIIFFQLIFAYLIPEILSGLNSDLPYFSRDLKNVWPLNAYFAEPWYLDGIQATQKAGPSGMFFFLVGVIMFLIITPVLTYYVGKRWYCSWVCGCGGLAETAGDPFRQLSSKKRSAWKLERWLIHLIMVFVLVMTIASFWSYFSGKEFILKWSLSPDLVIHKTNYLYATVVLMTVATISSFYFARKRKNKFLWIAGGIFALIGILLLIASITGNQNVFFIESHVLRKHYGFYVGSMFSGVIGVGFYPMLGSRVWCRFGCPMAGYMGLFQRIKSRFRITTNGGQCISCGNCSTYCEQGIDVRSYAQKGQNIVRASCVGCGICSAVCPRGVLKLENGPNDDESRTNHSEITLGNDVNLLEGLKK